ncbi:MAG: DNA-directed RNA polymerase subunit omega [Candidatus Omnitrophota bacterium]
MAYLPLKELLKKSDSVYKLVTLASKRAIELAGGAKRLVDMDAAAKPQAVAIQEIIEEKIYYKVKEKKSK